MSQSDREQEKEPIAMYNQLSGYTSPSKAAPARWLLVLALLCAMGFAAAHYAPQTLNKKNQADPLPQPTRNFTDADTEDQLQHIDNSVAALTEAVAAIQKSNRWVEGVLPLTSDGSLAARRLELARAAYRAAEERISHARDELQVTRNVLIERSSHHEH
jgi:hypothetical protein